MPTRPGHPVLDVVASTFKGNDASSSTCSTSPTRPGPRQRHHRLAVLAVRRTCAGISYQVAGMQSMVNAVRSTGATNCSCWAVRSTPTTSPRAGLRATDPDHNLVASWHSYNFNTCSSQSCWTSQITPVIAQSRDRREIGENDCADSYVDPLMSWLDSESTATWPGLERGLRLLLRPGLITDYTARRPPTARASKLTCSPSPEADHRRVAQDACSGRPGRPGPDVAGSRWCSGSPPHHAERSRIPPHE